jgi:hypothetical protein
VFDYNRGRPDVAKSQNNFRFDKATEETFQAMVDLFLEQGLIFVLPTTGKADRSTVMRAIVRSADPEKVAEALKGAV